MEDKNCDVYWIFFFSLRNLLNQSSKNIKNYNIIFKSLLLFVFKLYQFLEDYFFNRKNWKLKKKSSWQRKLSKWDQYNTKIKYLLRHVLIIFIHLAEFRPTERRLKFDCRFGLQIRSRFLLQWELQCPKSDVCCWCKSLWLFRL